MIVFYFIAIFFFILMTLLLCFVILMQEGKGGNLGASFGGDSGDSLFGASTADVLKRFTAYLAAAFLASCVVLSLWTETMSREQTSSIPTEMEEFES